MAEANVSSTDSGAVATPTPSATPPAAATPAPAAPAPQSATPAAPQAPATGAPGEGWVPSYRVRETREAAIREANQGFSQKEQQYQQELAQIRSQLHALVGVQPSSQNPEVTAVRNQFGQLYPGLSKLEERAADLMGLIDRAGDLESQNEHYWQTYGRSSMDRVFTGISEASGNPITDEGKRTIHSAFVGWVQQSPEMTARYAQDPSIVDDFVKA